MPTYHMAAIVDDHLMQITHVLRGEEWLPSFPQHWLLFEQFGWEPPIFVHCPVISGTRAARALEAPRRDRGARLRRHGLFEIRANEFCRAHRLVAGDERRGDGTARVIDAFSLRGYTSSPWVLPIL